MTENSANISFEVFPPKKNGDFHAVFDVLKELSELSPEFISVTYGAGGSMSKKTIEIASYIQNDLNIKAIAHLTCVGNKGAEIKDLCGRMKENNISYVLALRGDRPKDMSDEVYNGREFEYASDLIRLLKKDTDLHIVGACYPEKHFEAFSREADLLHMKEKQDLGVEFFISQLFFDNDLFYDFLERAERKGISVPIHAGIMPITSAKQIGTSISLSGSSIPKAFADLIANYGDKPEEMYKAGLDYAIRQIRDLKQNKVDGIHLYTMNKPDVARHIVTNI